MTDSDIPCEPVVAGPPGDLAGIVDALCERGEASGQTGGTRVLRRSLPSRNVLVDLVEALRSVLFPGYAGITDYSEESLHYYVGSTLDQVARTLQDQVRRGLCFACNLTGGDPSQCDARAREITRAFLARLPAVQRLLAGDVRAAFEGDPAATSPDEAIFCYPGVRAITNYRLAHELLQLGVPLIPRIITEHAHSRTGIDIHPGAQIGEQFFIDHGTGVVIGETCIIGHRVRIYQGVTLGAKSFPRDEHGRLVKGVPRHPIVEDDVTIYSGATVLGRVVIGRGSIIGGNVWLTHSVPPNSRIVQAPERPDDHFEGGAGI
jgi:serine O-acetyltransferase